MPCLEFLVPLVFLTVGGLSILVGSLGEDGLILQVLVLLLAANVAEALLEFVPSCLWFLHHRVLLQAAIVILSDLLTVAVPDLLTVGSPASVF